MLTTLFWNLSKNEEILGHLTCLAGANAIDVFVLAECPADLVPTIASLSSIGVGTYREEYADRAKVRALTRLGESDFKHAFTGLGRDLAIWTAKTDKLIPSEVFIAGVHLQSKFGGASDTDQALAANEVIEEIVDMEDNRNHRHTILVGDFNMNPYDPGMTSVAAVHGLMTKNLAELPDRVYRQQLRRRFYNPMWGLFGDRTPGPAGTHYWQSTVPHNAHWRILDQVLVRPLLIESLVELSILEDDGNHSLLSNDGFPSRTHMSDHLPVMFRLDV